MRDSGWGAGGSHGRIRHMKKPPLAAFALVVVAWGWGPAVRRAVADDLSGPHECALMSEDFHPCTLAARPEGGYDVTQPGSESFTGALTPQGTGFHLEGTYKYPSAPEVHLAGEVALAAGTFEGRVKAGKIPVTIAIRPAAPAKAPSKSTELSASMAKLVDKESVAAGTRFPLVIKVDGAPKRSFTVKNLDDAAWDKVKGIFGMVPPTNNIGIECKRSKLQCTLTAQSSAQVVFSFVRTSKGPKLTRVELPVEGD